jgi:excisionase family DNA binding protein
MRIDTARSATTRTTLSLRATAREYQLSTWTICAAIERGDLPAYRLPGQRRIRILRDDVLEWIRSYPVEESAGADHGREAKR